MFIHSFSSLPYDRPKASPKAISPHSAIQNSVSQPPGLGPIPGSGINYTGPREILLELITNLNVSLYLSPYHTLHISVLILFMIMT